MATKEVKTNAMRILDTMKIPNRHMEYECKEFTDGGQIADTPGLPHERVFKTLVTWERIRITMCLCFVTSTAVLK